MDNLGDRLKSAREELKLTIEEVSNKTKIRHNVIEAIESNDLSALPTVYMNSFIKTYSSFLKIPEEEILPFLKGQTKKINQPQIQILNYSKNNEKESIKEYFKKSPQKRDKGIIGKSKNQILYFVIYSLLFIAVVFLIVLLFFSEKPKSTYPEQTSTASRIADTAVLESSGGLSNYYMANDSFNLTAIGKDSALLYIDIDNSTKADKIIFYRGLELSWNAKENFILNISKEGAIEFKRNGQILPPFGPYGSPIRRVVIKRDEIISSSQSWTPAQDSIKKKNASSKSKKDKQDEKINKHFELDFSPIPQPDNPFKRSPTN